MNHKRETDAGYLAMAVFVAVFCMVILIVIQLPEYTRNGNLSLIIPIGICAVLILCSVPLLKHIGKTVEGGTNSGYYKAANLLAIFSMVSFILIRLPEYIGNGQYFRAGTLLVACFAVIALMILLMLRSKKTDRLAFSIPAVTFAMYTAGTAILGGTQYYFLTYLVICGIGAAYNNYKAFSRYVILSHTVMLALIAGGVPLMSRGTGTKDIMVNWSITAYTTVFLMMISRFSTEKDSRVAKAMAAFNNLMAATPNLISMVDGLHRVTYISKPLAELAYIEDYEMAVGRPLIDIFPEMDMKLVIGEILECEAGFDDTRALVLNGEVRHFKIVSDKLADGTNGRFIDISDVTPIMDARLEAEKANLAKSAFLAKMSHEIRTPMNAVIGMSELILREDIPPAAREYASGVKQAGSNLLSIINDILDFSKIESGKMEIIPVEYQLASLINDCIAITRVNLAEKPIYFAVDIDDSLPCTLIGDEARIRQILLNLLSNAVKYTNEGSVTFTVRGMKAEDGGFALALEIADTGTGIKDEDLSRLFGNFVQFDTAKHKGVEGTGLGLAITRNLCKVMGGDITVSSKYGEGSKFLAVIPQQVKNYTPITNILNNEEEASSSGVGGDIKFRFIAPDARILIVDDLATNLKVVEGLLIPYKMSTDICESGAEAVNLAQNTRYDIIFMDHMMPEMDGVEAMVAIRALPGGYYINAPIIALTANAVSGMREMFLQKGFNDYLSKPIEVYKLNELVEKWIPHEKLKRLESTEAQINQPQTNSLAVEFAVEGVDVRRGLAMTGGTQENYRAVLTLFCKDATARLEILRKMPDEETLLMFITQVHALKSAAASIGAAKLSEEAARLEDAGKRGDMVAIGKELAEFLEQLTYLVEGIGDALHKDFQQSTATVANMVDCRQPADVETEEQSLEKSVLLRLKAALETEEIAVADNILDEFGKKQLNEREKEIVAAISDLTLISEFKDAADMLDDFIREMFS
ncbi:ATP-binding protein [Lachnospiraceae bacterium ZAX-1]